jgi:class 3 adenylate cyclase
LAETAARESWRLLTIVFVDVVGSTPLSVVLDGEDYVELIDAYHAASAPITERHGGFLGRDEGDGRFIWFGWPEAAEDDAERAVNMALELGPAISRAAREIERRFGFEVSVRIGIHTGEIIVRDLKDGQRPILLGSAANLAAKVQDAARPGAVCISEATAALISDKFEMSSADVMQIGDLEGDLSLFEVTGRLETPPVAPTLVGRSPERSRLAESWRAVRDGGSRSVLITGEAGIGKSQLIASFLGSYVVDGPELAILADSYRQTESFGALRAAFGSSDLVLPDDLLGRLNQANTRAAAIEELLDAVRQRASTTPLVVLAEDIHWLDHSTSDLLSRLVSEQLPGVLLLATSRLSASALQGVEQLFTISLGPLASEELERVVSGAGRDLSPIDVANIVSKSAGNPFFATALVNAHDQLDVVGGRRALLPHSEVPIVVQQALRAQLDQSTSASSLASTAAVIGREFSEALLRVAHVNGGPADSASVTHDSIADDVAWLLDAGLIEASNDGYRFRHALARQLAYDLLVRGDRQVRHGQVADALVELSASDGRSCSTLLLGVHFDGAARWVEAAKAKLAAAVEARAAGAFHEGIELIDRVLEICASEEIERSVELEALELRAVLSGAADQAGYGANALDRERLTRLLSEEQDETALVRALTREWASAMLMSELRRGGGILRQISRLAKGDDIAGALARLFRGTHMMYRGNFRYAEPLLTTAALDLARLGLRPEFRANWSTADDPVSVGLSRLPPLLWLRGQMEEAEAMLAMAEAEAATIAGPAAAMSAAHVKANAALFYEQVGNGRRAIEIGAEICAIGEEPALAFWQQNGQLHQLIGAVQLEPTENLLDRLHSAAEAMDGVARLFSPMLYLETARGHLARGERLAARKAIAGAERVATETGALWLWAEVRRLGAAAIDPALADGQGLVAHLLCEAAVVARGQGARVYELRALADLIEQDVSGQIDGMLVVRRAEAALDEFPSAEGYPEVQRLSELLYSVV